MNEILVSVIISVFDSEKFVEAAVRSIMSQTYKNLEILIADDCSRDNSLEILQRLEKEDSRIRLVKNEVNLKLAKTLNKLIVLAKGKYIARMDSDDIALPERIEKQVRFLEKNPMIDFCGTNALYIDENNTIMGHAVLPESNEDCKYYFRYGNTFIHPSVMIKANVLKENPYSENFKYAQDYELWGRLLFKNNLKGYNLLEPMLKYRICNSQASNSHRNEQADFASSVLDLYDIREKKDLDLHKNIFFKYEWKKLNFKTLYVNLRYLKKRKIEFSKVIYFKLLKMSVRKCNLLYIVICFFYFPIVPRLKNAS